MWSSQIILLQRLIVRCISFCKSIYHNVFLLPVDAEHQEVKLTDIYKYPSWDFPIILITMFKPVGIFWGGGGIF